MALPFRRSSRSAHGEDGAFTQRLWEVQALLCSLSPQVREALFLWLLRPTDPHRWPPPDLFEQQRWPSGSDALVVERPTASRLLSDELKAIRQTLDLPLDALSGLTRNGLLTVHAMRLRQVERWLWPFYAAREIKRLTAQHRVGRLLHSPAANRPPVAKRLTGVLCWYLITRVAGAWPLQQRAIAGARTITGWKSAPGALNKGVCFDESYSGNRQACPRCQSSAGA